RGATPFVLARCLARCHTPCTGGIQNTRVAKRRVGIHGRAFDSPTGIRWPVYEKAFHELPDSSRKNPDFWKVGFNARPEFFRLLLPEQRLEVEKVTAALVERLLNAKVASVYDI